MKILAIVTCVILSFSACSQTKETLNLLKYATEGYNIQYPTTWRIDTSNLNGAELAIYSPKENEHDKFSENVNLIVQDLSGQNIDLEKYAQISEQQIKANAKDLKDFNITKVLANQHVYFSLSYEMTYGDFKLFTKQYYFVENEKAFVITFSSEIDKLKTIGNNILESFTLLK